MKRLIVLPVAALGRMDACMITHGQRKTGNIRMALRPANAPAAFH